MHRILEPTLSECPLEPGGVIEVTGEEARHAVKVKRLSPGEAVELLDGAGLVVRGRAARVDPRGSSVAVEVEGAARAARAEPRVEIAAPAPKGDRLDRMLDQLGQLGVQRWTPLICERSVRDAGKLKRERLERIAAATVKQCGRAWSLEIGEPTGFGQLLGTLGDRAGLVARADGRPLAEAAAPLGRGGRGVLVVIGPEGGLTEPEQRAADDAGLMGLRLGPHVLRTETAATAAAAVVMSITTT